MKKKIVSLLLVFVLGISAFLFAGCQSFEDEVSGRIEEEFSSENGQSSASQFLSSYIDGFKVVYTTSINNQERHIQIIDNIFYDDNLLGVLTRKYGTTDETTGFPDSIRQLIVADGENAKLEKKESGLNWAWNWTLNFDSPFTQQYICDKMVNGKTYEQFKNSFVAIKNYYPQLSDEKFYSTPIQIVMYEVLLGYGKEKLTTFEADTTSGFVVKVKNCPTKGTINGKNVTDSSVVSYLNEIQTTYRNSASYSGFTKNTADKFITYLLDEVVGSELVEFDYENYYDHENHKGTVNYRNYVGTIAGLVYEKIYDGSGENYTFTYKLTNDEILYEFVGKTGEGSELAPKPVGAFSAKPACFMSDFETEAFFEDGSAIDAMFNGGETKASFENSPLAEYQSVIMMPKEDYTFGGMVMQIFSANPDLQINMTLRFWAFDKETHTGTLYKFKQDGINFYQSSPILYDGEDESVKVDGKGYLYKAKDKDNDGNEINGYYTDFEIDFDINKVEDKRFVVSPNEDNPNELQIPYLKLDAFDNTNLKAEGESVNGRKEKELGGNSGYKVVEMEDSFGGVTVLDEKNVEFSFCEIMFDVVKDRTKQNQDYTYKLAVLLPG